jgi:hypothetical protein
VYTLFTLFREYTHGLSKGLELFELCSLSIEAVDDCVERRKRLVVSFETSQVFDFSYHSMVVGVDVLLENVHFQ